jgi:hypothetical protein
MRRYTVAHTESESKVRPEDYNRFIGGLQPRGIRLMEGSIDSPLPYAGQQLRARLSENEATYELAESGFNVRQSYTFEGQVIDSDNEIVVAVRATFELFYQSEQPMTDELFHIFRRVNLPVNTWPYFREFVQSSLARSEWPTTVLPAFKLGTRRREPRPAAQEVSGGEGSATNSLSSGGDPPSS